MSKPKFPAVKLMRRVIRLVNAEIDYSWRGAHTPEGKERIIVELAKARLSLQTLVFQLDKELNDD